RKELLAHAFGVVVRRAFQFLKQMQRNAEAARNLGDLMAAQFEKLKVNRRELQRLKIHAVFKNERLASVGAAVVGIAEAFPQALQGFRPKCLAIFEDATGAGAGTEDAAAVLFHCEGKADRFLQT